LDYLIVVAADLDIRVKRVIQRDHVTEQHVLDRMRNQLKQEMKMKVADFIIDNSGKKKSDQPGIGYS
jgi:dephospho-CoA kinase